MMLKKIKNNFLNIISLLFLSIFLNSCTIPSTVYLGDENYIKLTTQNQLSQDTLTTDAISLLKRYSLYESFQKDPDKILTRCISELEKRKNESIIGYNYCRALKGISEACIFSAQKAKGINTIRYWTTVCFISYKYLFESKSLKDITALSPDTGTMISYYNFSLLKIFKYLQSHHYTNKSSFSLQSLAGKIEFNPPQSNLPWKLSTFEKFLICYDFITENFNESGIQEGVGIPLGGIPEKDDYFPTVAKNIKIVKYMYPCTFFIEFSECNKKVIKATPDYIDYYKNIYYYIDKRKLFMPSAYSVLLGEFLKHFPHSMNTDFFFSPEKMLKNNIDGIYMLSPYDPKKIPVVMIHGFISDPQSYCQVLNTLMQCQIIRQNFQFWFYYYPTGQSVILDTYNLRNILNSINDKFNIDNKKNKFHNMVLVGYSLGGLIAQLAVQSSENDYFNKEMYSYCKKNACNLDEVKALSKMLHFDPLSFIKEVIFISTPHKGAEMASWLAPHLLANALVNSYKNYYYNLRFITEPTLKPYLNLLTGNSINDLAVNSPFIKFSQKLPYSERVKMYSIIGDLGGPEDPQRTDGIVTYNSSHLENASDEVIIKSDHHSINVPNCAMEIKKFLLESLPKNTE